MIIKEVKIGPERIVVTCADTLSNQAEWLLGLLARLYSQGVPIEEGKKIQFGWSMLSFIRREDGVLMVCEPDFTNDPFTRFREDISDTLVIQGKQNSLAERLGVIPCPPSFQDKIVLEKGCLATSRVYLERRSTSPGDSGWYIGNRDSGDKSPELDAIFVYQLLKLRPDILPVLCLGVGYLVIFGESGLEAIINEKDENALSD